MAVRPFLSDMYKQKWENRCFMKLFKRIYYPVLAVLIVAMLVLGFVDATYARPGKTDSRFVADSVKHVEGIAAENRSTPDGKATARTYIASVLDTVCRYADATIDDDGMTQVDVAVNTTPVPTYTEQETVLLDASLDTTDKLDQVAVVDQTVNNLVVYIPGAKTLAGTPGDAVLMTAHYDSRAAGVAASEAVPAAVMLQNIVDIVSGNLSYQNDLVFVFTDETAGALAFTQQFKGFDNVTDRVKLSADFTAFGDKGTLALYDVSDKNAALLGAYSGINGSAYASSLFDLFGFNKAVNGVDAFDGPYLGIGNVGGSATAADTVENLSQNICKQHAGIMTRFTEKFGDYDLNTLDSKSASVFFTYLSLFTVWYPVFVSYILGAVIVGLIVAVVWLTVKKNKQFAAANPEAKNNPYMLGRSIGGALVQLLSIAASVLTLFVSYYLLGLICAGFGAFNLHAINDLLFGNVAFLIGVMLLSAAVNAAFTLVLKKTFNAKAPDVVRGNVWLWAVLGLIFSFAAPKYGYIFAIGAILELVTMLLVTLFKDKYKAKFNQDIERLFLYNAPLVLIPPMAVPAITLASASLKTLFLPLIMMVFMLMTGFITPYLSYLYPVLDRVFTKLPDRKIREEHEYQEEKVDPAKPGKKGEIVTVKKVETVKVKWNYHNWMTVTAAVLASCLIVIFSTVFTGSFTATAASRFDGFDGIYDDALIYMWDRNSSGVVTNTIEVHDLDAYPYIARAVDGLAWDGEKKAYVKTDWAGDFIKGNGPTIEASEENTIYTFTPYNLVHSEVRLKITGAAAVTKLTFAKTTDAEQKYEVDNEGEDTLEVRLPYGYGAFTMTVEGTETKLSIDYTEHYADASTAFQSLDDWAGLTTGSYRGKDKITPYLRAGIVLHYQY